MEETGYDVRTEMTWGEAISRNTNSDGVTGLDVCYKLKGPEGLRYGARYIAKIRSNKSSKLWYLFK